MFFALLPRADGRLTVAWWTVVSCAVHAVRLAQALVLKACGRPLTSWLASA